MPLAMPAMEPWYNARKVGQVVSFFARRQGGAINCLKLAKLLYLADRANLSKYEFPITWDNFVSMPHGPVDSISNECVNGMYGPIEGWDDFVDGRVGYEVRVKTSVTDDDLDELSDAEIGTLDEVWSEFGHMGQYQIRDWTHVHCQEWENPHGSSNPIPLSRVLKFLGKRDAEEIEADLLGQRKVLELLA